MCQDDNVVLNQLISLAYYGGCTMVNGDDIVPVYCSAHRILCAAKQRCCNSEILWEAASGSWGFVGNHILMFSSDATDCRTPNLL